MNQTNNKIYCKNCNKDLTKKYFKKHLLTIKHLKNKKISSVIKIQKIYRGYRHRKNCQIGRGFSIWRRSYLLKDNDKEDRCITMLFKSEDFDFESMLWLNGIRKITGLKGVLYIKSKSSTDTYTNFWVLNEDDDDRDDFYNYKLYENYVEERRYSYEKGDDGKLIVNSWFEKPNCLYNIESITKELVKNRKNSVIV